MPQVVEQLAELTAYRDRDVADTTLVAALRDLLQARQVAIHRCVGDEADRRWLTRARLGLDDVAASADATVAALTNSGDGTVSLIKLDDLSIASTINVGGTPSKVVLVGGK